MTHLSISRPLTVLMGILALVLMGAVSFTYLKVERLPPIEIPTISVTVQYPQASAADVEQLVSEPLENALAGMSHVDTIESNSSEGRSQIRIQMVQGADLNQSSLDAQRLVGAIQSRLPVDILPPSIQKADPNSFPILNVAITGAPLDQLHDVAVNTLQPKLESVAGVGAVNVNGGLQREIQVRVDYARLAAYNLSVAQISSALTAANLSTTVGTNQQTAQLLNIRAIGNFTSLDDIKKVVVSQTGAGPVFLSDVSTVQEGYKDVFQLQRLNGQDSVGISIVKAPDANEIQTADAVKADLKQLQSALPQGASFQIRNDTSVFTKQSVDAVQHDIGLAILLVALITLLFLHSFRNALIVLLSVPTSMISTMLIMYIMGFSLNLMTLMALALLVGILVDSSIVVIENIHRHLAMGKHPRQAAQEGRAEIGLATIAIAAADIVVYIPIAFMSGLVGQLFREYGLTVVVATIFSLLISFTLTPMLASRWLREDSGASDDSLWSRFARMWDRGFDAFSGAVGWLVPLAVRSRWLVAGASVVLVVATSFLIQTRTVGLEYVPGEDDNNFNVNINTPPGTSLQVIDAATKQMEAALQQMPEVASVFSSISAGGGGGGGSAGITVQTVDKNQRTKSVFDLVTQVRRIGAQIPGTRVTASVASSLPGGGSSGGIGVDISGPVLDDVVTAVNEVEDAMRQVPGVADVTDNNLPGTPELQAVLDPARMAQLNVTTQQVTTALRTTLGGTVVTELRRFGQPQEDITVVAGNIDRQDLNKLASIPVKGNLSAIGSGTGATTTNAPPGVVTLGQVATIVYGTGPVAIHRINRQNTISVNGIASGRPLGDVATDMQVALKQVQVPAGVTVVPGQSVNQFNTAIAALGQALALSVILEYMLLVALYHSWLQPLALMLSVPLGLVGSIVGLWVTQNTINMYSIIGLIMAFGLTAKSGILLIDFVNTLRAEGVDRTEALAQAARIRLRPILMTSCTMAFGMLPLALKAEAGAESRAPMAVVVIGAIITSTILAIFVIPAVYTLFDDLSGATARFHIRRPTLAFPPRVTEPVPAPVPGGAVAYPGTNGQRNAPAPVPQTGVAHLEPRRGMPES